MHHTPRSAQNNWYVMCCFSVCLVSEQKLSPEKVYHVFVAPCFDKKLEAVREEFYNSLLETRDVDCVLTSGSLFLILRTALPGAKSYLHVLMRSLLNLTLKLNANVHIIHITRPTGFTSPLILSCWDLRSVCVKMHLRQAAAHTSHLTMHLVWYLTLGADMKTPCKLFLNYLFLLHFSLYWIV